MSASKTSKKETVTVPLEELIEVRRYDDIVGDYFNVKVKKEPVSACVLCGCAGCLSDKCCEHLEYWSNESGRPARYQINELMGRIAKLEELIEVLDKSRRDAATALSIAAQAYDKRPFRPEEVSLLNVVSGFLADDIAGRRTLFRKGDELCSACLCLKCNERLRVAMRNERSRGEYNSLPDCCGHSEYKPVDLPF